MYRRRHQLEYLPKTTKNFKKRVDNNTKSFCALQLKALVCVLLLFFLYFSKGKDHLANLLSLVTVNMLE